MNKKTLLIILLTLTLILSSCQNTKQQTPQYTKNQSQKSIIKKAPKIDPIKETLKSMTTDEKIGQLMIVGLDGTTIDEHTINMIQKNHIGGFILFKKNISSTEQTLKLLNELKQINHSNKMPLFLSVDEEGGKVVRLPKPFLKLPDVKKIGDINDEKVSLEYGKILGMRIKSLGFNMDFAPVFDINSNTDNPVIGNRAFGSTVDIVVGNGLQVMKGINSENVISIIKHFPGHGDTSMDSHIDIPVVKKDLDELEELELIPFIKGIDEDADGIMVAHILYPELDENNPATISKQIITGVLREKLVYDGVVISDDMTMGAIVKNNSIEDASIQFLKAGGDIILLCHGYEEQLKVINRIKQEVENGNITKEELDEKVYRVIKLKQKYNIKDNLIEEVDIETINDKTKEILDEI